MAAGVAVGAAVSAAGPRTVAAPVGTVTATPTPAIRRGEVMAPAAGLGRRFRWRGVGEVRSKMFSLSGVGRERFAVGGARQLTKRPKPVGVL